MRSREVSPRFIAAAVLITLAAVLALYWRTLLVDGTGPGGGGGGGPMLPSPPTGQEGVQVITLAGRPMPGYADGPGRTARFNGPAGVAAGARGTLYVSDSRNHRIRAVAADGEVRTVAGSGDVDTVEGGYADGPAAEARFRNPAGLAAAPGGALYIADAGNHCIRCLQPDGRVATVAGRPGPPDSAGLPSGDYADGPAAAARFCFPTALVVDDKGALIIADAGNGCIRRLAGGQVTTIAGRRGQAYADGPAAAARFRDPTAVARDRSGTLYVPDAGSRCLRAVAPDGSTRTVPAPHLPPPPGSTEWTAPPLTRVPAPEGTRLVQPVAAAVDAHGRLFVCDAGVQCLYLVTPASGKLLLLAGSHDESTSSAGTWNDGDGMRARFSRPCALAVAPDGTLLVADFANNCIRKVTVPPPGSEQDQPRPRWHGRRRGWVDWWDMDW